MFTSQLMLVIYFHLLLFLLFFMWFQAVHSADLKAVFYSLHDFPSPNMFRIYALTSKRT